MPPATRLCFSEICKDKSQQVDMKATKRAVYTSVSLSVSNPGSSLGVHQRSLWVSMVNPRMDEEHQDSGRKRATIERDVSPQISITPRDKQNKTERQLKSRKLTRSWSESVSWPDPVCSNASCALTVRTGFTQEIHVALRCCVKYGNASYSAAAFCYAYKWYI